MIRNKKVVEPDVHAVAKPNVHAAVKPDVHAVDAILARSPQFKFATVFAVNQIRATLNRIAFDSPSAHALNGLGLGRKVQSASRRFGCHQKLEKFVPFISLYLRNQES